MKVGIHQPNFLPWVGYFHKILESDVFVLFDDVQFPRGKSFGYRTAIKTNEGQRWLSSSVAGKGEQKNYNETLISDSDWRTKVLNQIQNSYRKAPHFEEVYPIIEEGIQSDLKIVSDFNSNLIIKLSQYLELGTEFKNSSSILAEDDLSVGEAKIINILKALGASSYLSGSGEGSKRYINPDSFESEGIELLWQEYDAVPYDQLWGEFIPNLSILDLIMNKGKEGREVLFASSRV